MTHVAAALHGERPLILIAERRRCTPRARVGASAGVADVKFYPSVPIVAMRARNIERLRWTKAVLFKRR